MKWTQITVFTTQEGIEPVCGRLSTLGIDQVQIQESREAIDAFLQETAKYWDFADLDELTQNTGPCVKAYVGNVADNAKLVEQIRQSFAELKAMDVGLDLGSLRVVAEVTDEEDWANNWKAYYKPLPIGERLLVCPSWEKADPGQRVLLSLDPGMAFGTGTHATTRLCLELLEESVIPGCTILDVGCGSGILSIGGVLLGASRADGVDIDQLAVKIAGENAALNQVEHKVHFVQGDLTEKISGQYDIICANIVADVIIRLCPDILRFLKPDGVFLASGIIDERAVEVENAIDACGLAIVQRREEDGWVALLCRRKGEETHAKILH